MNGGACGGREAAEGTGGHGSGDLFREILTLRQEPPADLPKKTTDSRRVAMPTICHRIRPSQIGGLATPGPGRTRRVRSDRPDGPGPAPFAVTP
jgi:hypothetical protein